ncbi:type VI secretion system Vgr family protein [Acinetobacter junii]|uniref:type VI secretion system Vgr family protein n=1 Tax=Acinetobacter TaxID=469 RepID=UPI0022EB7A7E|nr:MULTISPECIES: type VI secretion system Vgr family protein [Acinetobacter]MDA3500328.1 type VI secretion system tip protein VgrG [Acinetobacter sp. AOR34_HL]MDI9719919.1 type VI secretion system Vgr family protein [Acinetobacter junii]MDR7654949.1 type VI secretion system Vgr family protein [Acinetobacter junii]
MLNNIFQALDSFGLTAQKRALHILFSNPDLNTQVFLQRIDGLHQINQGVRAELICLSTHAAIPLKQFIGCQVAVDQVTDTGALFRTTGIITEAQQGQSDGSLTLYKLVLQDPTALWHKRRNSRVFMNKTVIEVFEVIFKEWQQRSPLFASSLTLDLSGLTQDYDVRPFIMSQNETDYDFITRLLRSEGINWLIDEDQLIVPNNQTPIQAQKLRLIDDNSQYQALARRSIRYHRSSATEQYDSMTSLIGQRSLQPTAVHIQRWQADALEQVDGAGSVQSTHQHSESYDNNSLSLEDAWHFTPAWMQDLTGADGATASGNPQIEKLNQNLSHYHDSQAKQFIANTTVRDSQVGYWFKLIEHPEIDQHTGADQEFLITAKSYYNQNNLPKDLQQQVHTLISQSQWKQPNLQTEERQANQLILQRRNIPIVSEYNPQQHRPITSPQRAKVVGPSDEEIHVDEWGRIKVRFLFTRKEDHEHDGGAGSNDNDTDSAWIDVLTPWAGEGYGARFLPRIGEIVVINFFDGNIDRPFVTGRIHEAHRSPTKFDNAGKLPDTKKLAGIKSKEVQGEGFNQLRFDDTTGQISAQLQSSHAASQLNLGKLSHPKDQAESKDRGEGFELRTDQWGAVRAGQGLLLSTHSQEQAQCDHLDAQPAKQQLESNQANAKALSEVAKNQQTDEIESLDQLKEFADQIQEKIAKFEKALLLLNSPAGIGLSTSEDIHLSADGQIDQIAGDSINLSTQKNLVAHVQNRISFFAAQSGIKQVAAKGRFEVHAQSDGMDLLAKQGVQIISTEDRIEISSPKEIVITAGGSQIKLNGSGIFPTTGGKFEVKAGQHLFMGGAKVPMDIPLMPNEIRKQLLLQYHDQEPVQGANFTIRYNNGQQYSGIVNNKGIADITDAPEGEGRIIFGEDQRPYQVVATADENPEYKSAWVIDDFEASYQQALQEKNK